MKKLLCALLSVLLIFTSMVVPVGAVEEEESGIFEYRFMDNGTAGIYRYNGTDENIVIPSEIDGYVVSAICSGAFDSEDTVASVTIPASITLVESGAFDGVITLGKIEFLSDGKRNLRVSEKAFNECTALSEIILPDERIYSIESEAFYESAFTNNSENWENSALYLGNILLMLDVNNIQDGYEIKDGTTVISGDIFFVYNEETGEYDLMMKEVILPDSIEVIGRKNGINLKKITDNLERIGQYGDINGFNFMADTVLKYKEYTAAVEATGYIKTDDLHVEYVENGWLLGAIPMNVLTGGLVTDEMYIMPGEVKYISDGYNKMLSGALGNLSSMNFCKNLILSENLVSLPLENPMCVNYENILSGAICQTVTFLNKDTEIFDSPDTITGWVHTICGYSGSTAEAYAKKYDRDFVDITNCGHEVTAVRGSVLPTCERSGYTGDTYCAYCAEFLEAGKITKAHGDDYYYEDGSECEDAYFVCECSLCGYKDKEVYVKGLGHLDEDFDGNCDYCGDFSDRARACSCKACKYHKGELNFIQELFTSIQLFFWKLFRIKEVCDCGITHWNR